ncbi:MAG: discoidin domain-containing protein [Clostridia bacterium]|nr:discoidin domain-containing protein [Clostridia bacterium]
MEAVCNGTENASLLTDNSSATGTTLTPVNGKVSVFFTFDDMQCVTMYTLTSHQDKTSAPRSFALYGSNDGKNWTLLDKREDITFHWETYTRPFAIGNANYYAEYRLDILTEHDVTLAEIELLANNQEEISRDTLLGAIARAEAKDTASLTEAEKAQVKDAIAAAKAVANDKTASDEAIQQAYTQLAEELDKAFYRVSTKAELQKLHDAWASESQGFWSNASWVALQDALTKAKGLLDSETATQKDCKNAEAAILKAVEALTVGYGASLSFGKEATASHSQPGEGAANALDGNPSTKWCSTSPQRDAYWLEVDLGDIYRVDGWAVMGAANEPGGTGYLSSEYRLQTKDENGNWVTVMTANPDNENVFTAQLEQPVVGQYFRLYVPYPACPLDGYVRIYEFHVYGEEYVPEPETETETETETESDTETGTETDSAEVTTPEISPDSNESDSVTEDEPDTQNQGCKSAAGSGAVAALAALTVAIATKKKRRSDAPENQDK